MNLIAKRGNKFNGIHQGSFRKLKYSISKIAVTCKKKNAETITGTAFQKNFGGERGIRTPGPFGSTVFKTAAFDRSAISPAQK